LGQAPTLALLKVFFRPSPGRPTPSEVFMFRRLCFSGVVPLVFVLGGCGSDGDLPTVPPAPPEGSVKPAGPPASLSPEAIKSLKGKRGLVVPGKLKGDAPQN
jgi:hypothetical protein